MSAESEQRLEELRANPGNDTVFRGTYRSLRDSGATEALAEAVRLHAGAAAPEYATRLYLGLAATLGTDPVRSGEALDAAVRAASVESGLIEMLERIATARGDGALLGRVLLHRAGSSASLSRREEVLRRLVAAGDESGHDALRVEGWLRLAELGPALRSEAHAALAPLAEVALADPSAAARYEQIVRAEGDQRGLLRLLEARLAATENASAWARLAAEVALLAHEVTRDADIALDYLQRAHQRHPESAPTLSEALRTLRRRVSAPSPDLVRFQRQLAEQGADWASAAALAEEEARLHGDPAQQAEGLVRAGDLLAARAGAVDAALPLYAEAARLSPELRHTVDDRLAQLRRSRGETHGEALRQLQVEVYERAGDWDGLCDLLRGEIATLDGTARASRLGELARVELEKLRRPDLALRSLAQALRSDADAATDDALVAQAFEVVDALRGRPEATTEFAALLEERQRWSDLVRLLRAQLASAGSLEERAHVHATIGAIVSERLRDPRTAAEELERACELAPGTARYYDAARTARLASGAPDDALRLLNREYRETQDPERRVELDCERARIYAQVKGDLRLALDAIFAALEEQDDEPRLRARFAELLAQGSNAPVVDALVGTLLERGDRPRAQSLLWLAGRELGFSTDAGAAFGLRATEVAALDPVRLLTLRDAVDSRGVSGERLRVYTLLADSAPSVEARHHARFTLAGLLLAADRVPEAIAHLEDLLDAEPEHEAAHLLHVDAVARRGDAHAAAAAIDRALAAAPLDADQATALLRRLAHLAEGELANPERAASAWTRLLEIEPGDAEARVRMRAYEQASGDARAYSDSVSATIPELTDAAEIASRHLELAQLAEDQLHDASIALAHWSFVAHAAVLTPADRRRARAALTDEALRRREFEEVPPCLADELEERESDDAASARAESVVDALIEAGAWDAAFDALGEAVAGIPRPSALLLDQRAQLALRGGRLPEAIDAFARWERAEPGAVPADRRQQHAWALLQREDIEDGTWATIRDALTLTLPGDELVEALAAQPIERVRDAAAALVAHADGLATWEATPWRYRAASLLARTGSDAEGAAAQWRRIVEDDPMQDAALDALLAQARQDETVDALRGWVDARAASLEDPSTGIALLRLLVATAPDDSSRADALRRVVDVDLTDIEAREALATWYRRTEKFAELADVLEDLADVEPDDARRKQHLLALARTAAYQLEDRARAIAALESAVELDPAETSALERLEKLYRLDENWPLVARTVERQAAVAADDDRRANLYGTLADLRLSRLDDRLGAIDAWKRVLTLEPANLPVMEELARLYAEGGDWVEHLAVLERLANATQLRDLQSEVYVRAARVMHEHAGRSADGFALLCSTLESVAITPESLDLVRESGRAAGKPVELAGALKIAAERETDGARRAALQAEIGRILDTEADEPRLALDWLLGCFDAAPGPGPVLDALESVAERRDARTMLVDVYKRLAKDDGAGDVEVAWRALVGSADVAEREVKRPDVAFDIYAQAAERPGMRGRAEEQMLRLAEAHTLWERWRDYLEGREQQLSGDALLDTLFRRAEVEESQLGDWQRAFESLIAWVPDMPTNARLIERIYDRARAHGAWDLVLRLYEYLYGEATTDDRRVAVLTEMARICEAELANADGAFTQTLRAWQLRPRDAGLRESLVARAQASGRRVDLLAAWEWEARHVAGDDARADALRRAVSLAADLDDAERHRTAARELLSLVQDPLVFVQTEQAVAERLDAVDAWLDAIAAALGTLRRSEQRAALRLHLGACASERGRDDAAAAWLRAGLTEGAQVDELRDALLASLRRLGDRAGLATEIDARLRTVEDADRRVALSSELVQLLLDAGDADRATRVAQRALAAEPDHAGAIALLEEHLAAVERWDDLVEYHLERAGRAGATDAARAPLVAAGPQPAAARPGPPDAARRHFVAAATIAAETLRDGARALRIADAMNGVFPSDGEAISLRARQLSELGRWPEYVETMSSLARASTGRVAARAWADAASATEAQLFASEKAQALWEEAERADPGWHVPLRERARLAIEAGRQDDALLHAAEARRRAETSGVAGRELADVLAFCADVLLRAGDPERAAEAVTVAEEAVAADPTHSGARAALEAALEATGNSARLIDLVDTALGNATDDDARVDLLLQRAQLCAFDARRDADARRAAERAASLRPDAAGVHAVLGDVHFYAGRYADAAAAYAGAFEGDSLRNGDHFAEIRVLVPGEYREADPHMLYATRLGISQVRAGDVDAGIERLEGVTLDDDRYVPAALELARALRDRGAWAAARVHVQSVLQQRDYLPAEISAEMQTLAARIAEEDGDRAGAARLYAAASTEVSDVQAARRAVQLSMQTGQTESVTASLEKLIAISTNPDERAAALASLAEIELAEPGTFQSGLQRLVEAVLAAGERSRALETAARVYRAACARAHGARRCDRPR